jgi:4a-hydroxytetrahydrobiopterin dehydratase
MQTAEVMDHHPDVLVTYGRVKVSTSTHDADGLTALDFELARRTDALDRGSAS